MKKNKKTAKAFRKMPVQTAAKEIAIKRCDDIEEAFKDYYENPDDMEAVHQVRVKIRKLRGVLNFFKPMMVPGIYIRVQSDLKDLANQFGDARETDVFLEELQRIEMFARDWKFIELEKIFIDKKNTSRSTLKKNLKVSQVANRLLAIYSVIEKEEIFDNAFNEDANSFIKRGISRWIKKTEKAVVRMNVADPDSIHEVRILSKKIRYVLESVSFMLNHSEAKKLKGFESIQDDLGTVHDAYVNADVLMNIPNPSVELQKEIAFVVGWQMSRAEQIMGAYQGK
ncbi:CHAD domain-containing protein [Eubacteriaceae bacterium ES3]|nr:CHAD domain-containing protein [Eubacteriaceae bacterium ES3]